PLSMYCYLPALHLPSFPTRRSSDLVGGHPHVVARRLQALRIDEVGQHDLAQCHVVAVGIAREDHAVLGYVDRGQLAGREAVLVRSEEHTSELQSRENLVCRLLLEKK